jgi:hypothetical protein
LLPDDSQQTLARAIPGDNTFVVGGRPATRALVKADSILLASWASVPLLMVYDRRFALSRAAYAGTQVLFCSAMTVGS